MPGDADSKHPPGDTRPEEGGAPTLVKSLGPSRTTGISTSVNSPEPSLAESVMDDAFARRYFVRSKLGEGGMGEVHLCEDVRIGRDIAMKVIRESGTARRDLRRRFVREARVQGQLEHPAIVPVYDLGVDPSGASYFTMRRLRGATLEQVLHGLRDNDPAFVAQQTRHKLLTAFGNVCLAIHFAHTRGVLHRDLKPDNVMLGDFGEVYVLDWGLAKVLDDEASPASNRPRAVTPDTGVERDVTGRTAVGAVMGTPGFMAPEQIQGDGTAVGPSSDIYALGAILFEILTLEPLHRRGSSESMMQSTVLGVEARAAVRAPDKDIPPELEAIYLRATATAPGDRFATARELYEAIEAFQSGDRDVARRRQLAAEHAAVAAEAAAIAIEKGDAGERARAMLEVSRAMALDPDNAGAVETLVQLFTSVPRELPREAKRDLALSHRASQRVSALSAAVGYLSWVLYLPLVVWMGVEHGLWGAACDVIFIGAAGASMVAARVPRLTRRASDVALILSTLGIVGGTGLFGPFILLPGLAAVNTVHFVVSGDRSRRVPATLLGCLAIVLPFILQWFGILPGQMTFSGGQLTISPEIAAFPEGPTLVFLLLANVAIVVTASFVVGRFRDALTASDERLHFQTWQLRQLVPSTAYRAVSQRPPASTTAARKSR